MKAIGFAVFEMFERWRFVGIDLEIFKRVFQSHRNDLRKFVRQREDQFLPMQILVDADAKDSDVIRIVVE